MDTLPLFTFDRNYRNTAQALPYWDGYAAALDRLDPDGSRRANGATFYNDEFVGQVPGLIGSPDEETGIYLLQGERHRRDMLAEVEAFKERGGEELAAMAPGEVIKVREAMYYGHGMGGFGITCLESGRIIERDGKPYGFIPKGKRTHGYMVKGTVLILR